MVTSTYSSHSHVADGLIDRVHEACIWHDAIFHAQHSDTLHTSLTWSRECPTRPRWYDVRRIYTSCRNILCTTFWHPTYRIHVITGTSHTKNYAPHSDTLHTKHCMHHILTPYIPDSNDHLAHLTK